MKKKSIMSVLICLLLAFSLAACGGGAGSSASGSAAEPQETESSENTEEKSTEEDKEESIEEDKEESTEEKEEAAAGEEAENSVKEVAEEKEEIEEKEAGETAPDESAEQEEETAEPVREDPDSTGAGTGESSAEGSDALVVYFSRTGEQYGVGVIDHGNTAIVAEMIMEETGADGFEIVPEEDYYPYTYDELTDIAKKEQNENARPAYAAGVPDLSQYSTIFIGAPVWWGDWPMIMYTFFETNAEGLAGKTLVPFCTHAGSGLSGFDSKLAAACPDSTVAAGLAIAGTDTQNSPDSVQAKVTEWLAGLGQGNE